MDPSTISLRKTHYNYRKILVQYQQDVTPRFLLLAEDFYENFMDTGKVDLNLIMSALESFDEIYDGESTNRFYKFVFDLLEELKCKEPHVLQFCLHRYFKDRLMGYGYKGFNQIAYLDRSKPYRNNILIPSFYRLIIYDDLVNDIWPFFMHDYKTYSLFLRYGVNIDIKKAERQEFMTDVVSILQGYDSDDFIGEDQLEKNIEVLMRLMSKVPNSESWRRRFSLAMLVIDSLVQLYYCFTRQGLCSLQLLFKTIPDAYITSDELTGILNALLESHDERELVVDEYSERYEEFFPEAAKPLQPRSLKHLARVQVRQCMAEARSIHFGVPHLRVPKTLEKYLLLDMRDYQPETALQRGILW